MPNLYLIDKANGEAALSLAKEDDGAKVVLIQDGVYLNPEPLKGSGVEVYAVKRDVERRGLGSRLPDFVKLIDYPELVDLIVENKVVNFA